jgi:hypothetical protein
MEFPYKSTYRNLLWKTAVNLKVVSGHEISIGKYVKDKTSPKPRYYCRVSTTELSTAVDLQLFY